MQQKTGLKNVLLEKKLEKLSDLLEQREAQISEVLAAAQLDPAAVVNVNKKLEVYVKRNLITIELDTNNKKTCNNKTFPCRICSIEKILQYKIYNMN